MKLKTFVRAALLPNAVLLVFMLMFGSCKTVEGKNLSSKDSSTLALNENKAGYNTYSNLVWSDEFNCTSLNSSNWTCYEGTMNNPSQLQYYKTENVVVANGHLAITVKKEAYGGKSYTSGRISSKDKQSYQYGKIEAYMLLPIGTGLGSSFWSMGNLGVWPGCGEIDVLEYKKTSGKIYGTTHWDDDGHKSSGVTKSFDPSGWHKYAIVWNSSTISWYVDDVQYGSSISISSAAQSELQQKFYFLFNLCIGDWHGNPDDTTPFPSTFYVDYIRVYQ